MKVTKLLKRVALTVASAGTTVIIAACYGAYSSDDYAQSLIFGNVTNSEGTGVQALEVCSQFETYESCDYTYVDGTYNLAVDDYLFEEARQNGFTLAVRDVDGEENGRYHDASVDIEASEVVYGGVEHDVVLEAMEPLDEETSEL